MRMDRERENYVQLLEFTPRLRRRVQDTIDELTDLLDRMDAAGEDREEDDSAEHDDPAEDGADADFSLNRRSLAL